MMASRVLSRFLPVAEGDVSVYEGLRRQQTVEQDLKAQDGSDVDEANFNNRFQDHEQELENVLGEAANSRMPTEGATFLPRGGGRGQTPGRRAVSRNNIIPRWLGQQVGVEEEEDVPESLLLEGNRPASQDNAPSNERASGRTDAQWRATQKQQRLHKDTSTQRALRTPKRRQAGARPSPAGISSPKDTAMWLYTNASNLDAFLMEVYEYYIEHGIYSIILSRAISLFTEAFVFSFAIFLTTCVDYSKVPTSKSTSEVLIPKCMQNASWVKSAALWLFTFYWLSTLFRYLMDVKRLWQMHDFYHHVLGIVDSDIQTVSWRRVVDGLVKLRDANIETADPSPQLRKYTKHKKPQQRIQSAEDIANRLMRQDNYYVAFYNKDILDLTLPLPFAGQRQFYSKSFEWCIDFCLTNFVFDEQGHIRPFCLDVKNRSALVEGLRLRFRAAALISVLLAPFNILRYCTMYFFRYYTEFSRNPSQVGARTFTPFAEWKIREFNELPHLFQRRLRQAYPFANEYLNQFPKDKMTQACRFISFVSGALAAVLAIATLLDPELFLGFEITPGRTAVFWLTVTVGIFGVTRGAVPDDNEVHDPVLHLREVLMYTHYMPAHWKDRLHSNEVRSEFSALYQMKIVIFFEEVLSLIVAPWILWRNSGRQSERIIDFFRESTVHVDGIGHQCNFAVFDFKKNLNAEDPAAVMNDPDGLRDEYYGLKDDKMVASVQNFMQYYSHYNHNRGGARKAQGWNPPPVWPGLMSPRAVSHAESQAHGPTQGGRGARSHSLHRSNVLDPLHQRSGVLPKRSPQLVAQTAYSRDRKPLTNYDEEEEDRRPVGTATHGISESRLIEQDSDLKDWMGTSGKDHIESDTDADEGMDKVPGNNGGVLGLLYQFSKAQTEKGTGVNI